MSPRVWLWQLDVFDAHEFGGHGQLDMIGTREFGDGPVVMWFVPTCVDVAVGCGSVLTRVAVAVEYGWVLRVWR